MKPREQGVVTASQAAAHRLDRLTVYTSTDICVGTTDTQRPDPFEVDSGAWRAGADVATPDASPTGLAAEGASLGMSTCDESSRAIRSPSLKRRARHRASCGTCN